ncbi:MAG: hypothetical protein AAGF90_23450 [Pseudomonadota bacterium]
MSGVAVNLAETLKATAGEACGAALRRAAYGAAVLTCLIVAAGFATAAGWSSLAASFDPIIASLIVSAVFAAVGVMLIVSRKIAVRRARKWAAKRAAAYPSRPATTDGAALIHAVVNACATGVTVGRRLRR